MNGRHRGVALIMTLLGTALAVVLVSGMIRQQSIDVLRATHALAHKQGESIARGAEIWASRMLINDWRQDRDAGLPVDSGDEFWARYALILPLEGEGIVEVQIDDLGGRINLNNLITASGRIHGPTQRHLTRLLTQLGITEPSIEAVIDWIDPDRLPTRAAGAEDNDYQSLAPGYLAPNRLITDVSELRLLKGMTEPAYQALRPHIVALPVSGSPLNLNVATKTVLQSLSEGISDADVSALITRRQQRRFEALAELPAWAVPAQATGESEAVGLRSHFFDLVVRVTLEDSVVERVTRVYRTDQGDIQTVHRDLGQQGRITKASRLIEGESR